MDGIGYSNPLFYLQRSYRMAERELPAEIHLVTSSSPAHAERCSVIIIDQLSENCISVSIYFQVNVFRSARLLVRIKQ